MKSISNILDLIDSGDMALPEFQRGYVWNRDQVRGLFDSLYRRHPVGSLLVWVTESATVTRRGDGPIATGSVNLLLDGQQRMTSLYGVVRGEPPQFFDGNPEIFNGLNFHLENEIFEFYQPVKMRDDPLWVDVTELMKGGTKGFEVFSGRLSQIEADQCGGFVNRLIKLLGIKEIKLNIEEVTGEEKTLDIVVDIFNRVNSGGTKLTKGDLALAKICAEWPEARNEMKRKLKKWEESNYYFNLDWLLRSVNTVLTGEANFVHLHNKSASEIQDGLTRACNQIDASLDLIADRLGLDHDRVLFGRYAVPVMARYMDRKIGRMDAKERDKLLFWFVQAGMWGRFSGSTESIIDQDLAAIEDPEDGLNSLLEQLRLWQGGFKVEPDHFNGSTIGARFYPVLYMLTRMKEAKDWGSGVALRANLLGRMASLEMHHIFPKSRLNNECYDYTRSEVNAVANFCFLTKETNLDISNRLPEEYFPEIEENYPGALSSQWIPMDTKLWRIEAYRDFLAERRKLLAKEANHCFVNLLNGETEWLQMAQDIGQETSPPAPGRIASEDEEITLKALNDWVVDQNLSPGIISYDHSDPETGKQLAVFDIAWPNGLQPGLSGKIAVLLDEPSEVLAIASAAGYRCFISEVNFRRYIDDHILNNRVL